MTKYFTTSKLAVDYVVTDSITDAGDVWDDWVANGPLNAGSVFNAYGDVFLTNLVGSPLYVDQSIFGDDFFVSTRYGGLSLNYEALYTSTATTIHNYGVVPYFQRPSNDSDFHIVWQNDQVGAPSLTTPYGVYVSSSSPRYKGFYAVISTDSGSATIEYAWYITLGELKLAVSATGKDQPIYIIEQDTEEATLVATVPDGQTKIIEFVITDVGVAGQVALDILSLVESSAIATVQTSGAVSAVIEDLLESQILSTHSIGARANASLLSLFDFRTSAFNSSLDVIGSTNIFYTMVLDSDSSAIEVPISSWQATVQVDRQSYAQCVVPAVANYVSAINSASTFTIYRKAVSPNGQIVSTEMLSSPIGSRSYSRGSRNYTCTMSGYSDAFNGTGSTTPIEAKGVRSITDSNGSYRLRCSIDWVLRPNNVIQYDGTSFTIAFINYYVNATDQYMDVGDR